MSRETEQEALTSWIKERKIQAFEYAYSLMMRPSEELKHYGYQTKEGALIGALGGAVTEIEKRIRAFERKYPV